MYVFEEFEGYLISCVDLQASEKHRFLEEYEDMWPARAYLGQYLSQRNASLRKKMRKKQNISDANALDKPTAVSLSISVRFIR
jgi:hypothetical protein